MGGVKQKIEVVEGQAEKLSLLVDPVCCRSGRLFIDGKVKLHFKVLVRVPIPLKKFFINLFSLPSLLPVPPSQFPPPF